MTLVLLLLAVAIAASIVAFRYSARARRTCSPAPMPKQSQARRQKQQTMAQHAPLTSNQLDMLRYAKKRGGLELVVAGEVLTELPGLSTPGEAKTLNSLVRRGFLKAAGPGIYRLTPEGERAIFNAGQWGV